MLSGLFAGAVGAVAQHPALALLATFVGALIEALALVGAVVPGTGVVMAVAGAAAASGLPMAPYLAAAVGGAVLGDGLSFWIGSRFGPLLRRRWPLRQRPGLIQRADAFFRRFGAPSVAIARFVPVLRSTVPLAAGMAHMPARRFFIANVLSALLWAPAHVYPAQLAGLALGNLHAGEWRTAALFGAGLLIVGIAAFFLHRMLQRRLAEPPSQSRPNASAEP